MPALHIRRLTPPTVYCIILYESSDTAGDPLNLVSSALYHSAKPFSLCIDQFGRDMKVVRYTILLPCLRGMGQGFCVACWHLYLMLILVVGL